MSANQPADRDVEAAAAFHRCSDVHAERHDMGGVGTCAACRSWGTHLAAALLPLIREREAAAWERALRLPRQVEADMSDQAAKAWRSADARRGLADHDALLVHADALTRWSERFRMAFDGEDYRDDRDAAANPYTGSEGK